MRHLSDISRGVTDGRTDGWADGRRDGGTDERTDGPSYEDAIARLKRETNSLDETIDRQ